MDVLAGLINNMDRIQAQEELTLGRIVHLFARQASSRREVSDLRGAIRRFIREKRNQIMERVTRPKPEQSDRIEWDLMSDAEKQEARLWLESQGIKLTKKGGNG